MRTAIYLLLYLVSVSSLLAGNDKAGAYHHSNLYEEEVLYIGDNLAIFRNVSYYGSDINKTRIKYTLYESEWGGSPELSSITGNIIKNNIINDIKGMGWDASRGIFFGKGVSPLRNRKGNEEVYFMVFAVPKKIDLYKTEAEMKAALKESGVTDADLIGSEMYFRKLVENSDRFVSKKQK